MGTPVLSDGNRRFTVGSVALIGFLFLLGGIGLAQERTPKGNGIEGFRELEWGTSIERSTMIYPDLAFERYVVSGKEEPWKVYVRTAEHAEIEHVWFDSIEYWFRKDRFLKMRALMQSSIGPRTLVTQAENDYGKLESVFTKRYGAPSDRRTDYFTELIIVVKEATWNVDRSAVIVRYDGAGQTNMDVLTLTMQEKSRRGSAR